MKVWVKLLRLRQWSKNLFMIFPLIFSGHYMQIDLWIGCLLSMAGFCLISSGMYIINDIADLEQDRLHPMKKSRPLAASTIQVPIAAKLSVVLLLLGFLVCLGQGNHVFLLSVGYVLLHIFYNLYCKHVIILDVLSVAFGFSIRVSAGAAAVHVIPSAWLQLCMFILALFLVVSKRWCEIKALGEEASLHRPVLSFYTSNMLDKIVGICATLVIVFYGLYAISPEVTERIRSTVMMYSIGFVIYGIFRYLYLMHFKMLGGDPSEVLLSDIPLIINIFLWLIFILIFNQRVYV